MTKKVICLIIVAAAVMMSGCSGLVGQIVSGAESLAGEVVSSASQYFSSSEATPAESGDNTETSESVADIAERLIESLKDGLDDSGVMVTSSGLSVSNDKGYTQVGGTMPSDMMTDRLPRIDFGTLTVFTENEDGVTVTLSGVSLEQAQAYAADCAGKGFNLNADTTSANAIGLNTYTYTANDSDGCAVTVTLVVSILTITLNTAD